jgi:hypothetical protein
MSISIEKSVRTCDVNTGEANRIQSDRFFNPSNMVCIPWNGLNNKGQEVAPDSFWTKTAGCDSAEDRVMVENDQRPKYFNYVTLGAQGVEANIYGSNESDYVNSVGRTKFDKSRNKITGNFGSDFGANINYTSCSINAYERGMAQMNQQMRGENFLNNGMKSNTYQAISNNNRRRL